jgi:hypothetical protein
MKYQQKTMRFLTIFLTLFLVVSCQSKITHNHYDQIHPGMRYSDVIEILGEPNSTSAISLGTFSGTSANWKRHHGEIKIQFLDGIVKSKSYTSDPESQSQSS